MTMPQSLRDALEAVRLSLEDFRDDVGVLRGSPALDAQLLQLEALPVPMQRLVAEQTAAALFPKLYAQK